MGLELYLLRACLVLSLLAWVANAGITGIFNVKHYGAVANGRTDSTKAFQQAWSEACAAEGKPQILIPQGDYLVGPLLFKGPCKGPITVQLNGNLLAHTNLQLYSSNWLDFQYIDGLTITGLGKIDGQGALAWPHNQCPKKWECKLLPISLVLGMVNNATITGISSVNSKLFHMNIFGSKNIDISWIKIDAPEDSPNTDGIHIGGSSNINIINSTIGTGDDCVSIGSKTTNVTVSGVYCGPGHGISVGSLGKNPHEGDVVGLTVRNCTITETMNGVRIKTWQSKPSTTATSISMRATNFIFDDIVMRNVSNPIIIDQEYCPYVACTESAPSRVKISDIAFRNIRGTSATPEAIKLVCSGALPCDGVELSDINLEYIGGKPATTATSACVNVRGTSNGNVKPGSCI